jgi:hypothetical protein
MTKGAIPKRSACPAMGFTAFIMSSPAFWRKTSMHNVERLAADLAPFFKKGGNNGYSGDGSCKRLNLHDSAVTIGRGKVSPVSPRVVTARN